MSDPKRPEFVLIDEREGKKNYTYFSSDSQERMESRTEERVKSTKGRSISPRLLCFFGLVISTCIQMGLMFFAALTLLWAALSFFQDPVKNKKAINRIKGVCHLFFVMCSAFIGIFYPPLGIGLVMAYFSSSFKMNPTSFRDF